jgi:hypothetical protein
MPRNLLIIAVSLVFCAFFGNQGAFGMPASPVAVDLCQPDGTKIQLNIHGDERFHWFEDIDGYTVVRDKGRYAYGRLDSNGRLVASDLTVGRDNPKARGLKKKILPPPAFGENFGLRLCLVKVLSPLRKKLRQQEL